MRIIVGDCGILFDYDKIDTNTPDPKKSLESFFWCPVCRCAHRVGTIKYLQEPTYEEDE